MSNMTAETVAKTDAVDNSVDQQKKNRIQVSNTKKPLFFYVNLAKVINPAFLRFLFHFRMC